MNRNKLIRLMSALNRAAKIHVEMPIEHALNAGYSADLLGSECSRLTIDEAKKQRDADRAFCAFERLGHSLSAPKGWSCIEAGDEVAA